jgi:galactonate dehydratase
MKNNLLQLAEIKKSYSPNNRASDRMKVKGSKDAAMASRHVCASVPNFMILKWPVYFHTDPMFKEIVSFDGPMVSDRFIQLLNKPGIGVEINEEGIASMQLQEFHFF